MNEMCSFFEISRAAYYAWRKRMDRPDPDQERLQQVLEAYQASRRTYGYRRIEIWLRQKRGRNGPLGQLSIPSRIPEGTKGYQKLPEFEFCGLAGAG